MPIPRRIAVLLVAMAVALPTAAAAQAATPAPTLPAAAAAQAATPPPTLPTQSSGSSRPPVKLGRGGSDAGAGGRSASAAKSSLPNTGSDPRLLFLTGVALTLLGAGLRLRTADADVY